MKKKGINNKRIEKIRMIKNNSKTKLSEYEKQIIKKFKEALIVNEIIVYTVSSSTILTETNLRWSAPLSLLDKGGGSLKASRRIVFKLSDCF